MGAARIRKPRVLVTAWSLTSWNSAWARSVVPAAAPRKAKALTASPVAATSRDIERIRLAR
jgi:hypothetical protein